MATPESPTTELEAVNIMLRAIGEAPVTSTASTQQDTAVALQMLKEAIRDLCAEGWHWNTDDEVELSEASNEIAIPSNALFVDPVYAYKNITVRDGKLWDRDDNTDQFDTGTTVKCKIIRGLTFDDLMQSARTYATMLATERFVKYMMGEEGMVQFTADDLLRARTRLVKDEEDHADNNMAKSLGMRNMMSRYRDRGHNWGR